MLISEAARLSNLTKKMFWNYEPNFYSYYLKVDKLANYIIWSLEIKFELLVEIYWIHYTWVSPKLSNW